LHIVSHFPNNKHLGEESRARQTIEDKILHSFMNMEDMIRNVEVNLQVSENFKRSKPSNSARQTTTDDEEYLTEEADFENPGHRMISPYIFKVTVTLTNKRTIVLANAEKHAQPTLMEGLDHMVDVIKKSLRQEKDKAISAAKKEKSMMDMGDVSEDMDPDAEAEFLAVEIEAEADRKAEEMYRRVEAKSA
jgi:ribosome-associated translation inhibitor RaiA